MFIVMHLHGGFYYLCPVSISSIIPRDSLRGPFHILEEDEKHALATEYEME